VTGAQGL